MVQFCIELDASVFFQLFQLNRHLLSMFTPEATGGMNVKVIEDWAFRRQTEVRVGKFVAPKKPPGIYALDSRTIHVIHLLVFFPRLFNA